MDERAMVQSLSHMTLVGYAPFDDEPDYRVFLKAHGLPEPEYIVPASEDILPTEIRDVLVQQYSEKPVALFLPGRQFDISGTRHGRGHGWYDRLLSSVPDSWIRVGVLKDANFSPEPLVRKDWDEPVDFLLIERDGIFEVQKTGARPHVLQS